MFHPKHLLVSGLWNCFIFRRFCWNKTLEKNVKTGNYEKLCFDEIHFFSRIKIAQIRNLYNLNYFFTNVWYKSQNFFKKIDTQYNILFLINFCVLWFLINTDKKPLHFIWKLLTRLWYFEKILPSRSF